MPKVETCPDCKGTCLCAKCQGKGNVVSDMFDILSFSGTRCKSCRGTGECATCQGRGVVPLVLADGSEEE